MFRIWTSSLYFLGFNCLNVFVVCGIASMEGIKIFSTLLSILLRYFYIDDGGLALINGASV